MRPQDIVILLKIICFGQRNWYNKDIANELFISTSEVSTALDRCALSGLIDAEKKKVRIQALLEFLIYGLKYIFPQRPQDISRGIPTAHSHPFMQSLFGEGQMYVWPDPESNERGLSVQPLYKGATAAVKIDEKLYLMLALTDVLRMGKTREKEVAIKTLKELFEQ